MNNPLEKLIVDKRSFDRGYLQGLEDSVVNGKYEYSQGFRVASEHAEEKLSKKRQKIKELKARLKIVKDLQKQVGCLEERVSNLSAELKARPDMEVKDE